MNKNKNKILMFYRGHHLILDNKEINFCKSHNQMKKHNLLLVFLKKEF
jgi:hypothetical protein